MEDRLASSLRVARDRTTQNVAARQPVGSQPTDFAAEIDPPRGFARGGIWPFATSPSNQPRISPAGTIVLSLAICGGVFGFQKLSSTSREHDAASTKQTKQHDHALTVVRSDEDGQEEAITEPSRRTSRASSFFELEPTPAEHRAHQPARKNPRFETVATEARGENPLEDVERRADTYCHPQRSCRPTAQTALCETPSVDDFGDAPPAFGNHGRSENVDSRSSFAESQQVIGLFGDRPNSDGPSAAAHAERPSSKSSALSSSALESLHRRDMKTADWNWSPTGSFSNASKENGETSVPLEPTRNAPDNSGPRIVPGKLMGADAAAMSETRRSGEPIQQTKTEFKADRTSEIRQSHLSTAEKAEGVYTLFDDRLDAKAAKPDAPAPNPLTALDQTKLMSFGFKNAPWSVVLAEFASATGLELRMQAFPRGVFNRWDTAHYKPSQILALLNVELAKMGFRVNVIGNSLVVVRAAAAAPSSSQAMATRPSSTVSRRQAAPVEAQTIQTSAQQSAPSPQ